MKAIKTTLQNFTWKSETRRANGDCFVMYHLKDMVLKDQIPSQPSVNCICDSTGKAQTES